MDQKLSGEQQEIIALRERVSELEFENARMVRQLRGERIPFPRSWGLTQTETKFLSALMSSPDGSRPHEVLHAALYAGRELKTENILATVVRRVRRKLSPEGVAVLSRHGFGYELPPASREIIAAACAQKQNNRVMSS